ncbi:hypothetical protein [Sphingomonas sp. URHD0057]|uniref:hypothetical protein n=1 Tax=Sphingomonas sp. URHD0057 TaxID=1380389 RepID=UPI00048CEEEC|nr:hypothetical protein [Sphingomonas sp. URHD0057]
MKDIFGGVLVATGILLAGGSGLCSMVVLFTPGEYSGLKMWQAVAVFGGVPFAIGLVIAFGGIALVRSARAAESHDAESAE